MAIICPNDNSGNCIDTDRPGVKCPWGVCPPVSPVCPPCPVCPVCPPVNPVKDVKVVQKTSAQPRIMCKKVVNKKTGRYEMQCKPDVSITDMSITNVAKPAQKSIICKRVMDKTKKRAVIKCGVIGSF